KPSRRSSSCNGPSDADSNTTNPSRPAARTQSTSARQSATTVTIPCNVSRDRSSETATFTSCPSARSRRYSDPRSRFSPTPSTRMGEDHTATAEGRPGLAHLVFARATLHHLSVANSSRLVLGFAVLVGLISPCAYPEAEAPSPIHSGDPARYPIDDAPPKDFF